MKTEFSSSIFYSVEVEGNSLVLSVSLGDKTRQARVDFLSPVEAVSVAYFLEMMPKKAVFSLISAACAAAIAETTIMDFSSLVWHEISKPFSGGDGAIVNGVVTSPVVATGTLRVYSLTGELCQINTFDFGSGNGDVDVIVAGGKTGRALAWMNGDQYLNEPLRNNLVAVDIRSRGE